MADLLQSGAVWLAGQLQSHAGQTVTYSRSGDSVELTATVGPEDRSTAGDIVLTTVGMRDFLIQAADLEFVEDVPVVPQRGDRITWGSAVYEVRPPADGVPHWRWSDPYKLIRRIHTKLVG